MATRVRSRTGRNSIASTRSPSAMCSASATTMPPSANLTSGVSVTFRNLSRKSAPLSAPDSAQKCSGRKIASAMPASRCRSAARKPGWRVRGAHHPSSASGGR